MRIPFAALSLFLGLTLPVTSQSADAPKPTTSTMDLAKQLENGDFQGACATSATVSPQVLVDAWEQIPARKTFIFLCNQNTSANKLFPGVEGAALKGKTTSYCNFKPAIRLCLVCHVLLDKVTLLSATNTCSAVFSPEEREEFNSKVLGPNAPNTDDGAATPNASAPI